MPEPWVVVGVPIDSVGRSGGTELAPAALRERDLLSRLGAEDRGDLDVAGSRWSPRRRTRAEGLANAAERAAQRLGPRFFVHLDVDVLDERAMPATDYLMPDGLQWDELAALLEPLGHSSALVGFSLGCLNPEKDPDGSLTERTCALLTGALAAR